MLLVVQIHSNYLMCDGVLVSGQACVGDCRHENYFPRGSKLRLTTALLPHPSTSGCQVVAFSSNPNRTYAIIAATSIKDILNHSIHHDLSPTRARRVVKAIDHVS